MVNAGERNTATLKIKRTGQFVRLFECRRLRGGLALLVEVKGDVCELLFNVSDDLSLSCGGECVASLSEDLHQVVGQISASEVEAHYGVGKGIALVDRDGV